MLTLLGIALAAATLLSAADAPSYAQAEALVRSGHWTEGIALLRPIVQQNPGDLKARNLLGIALSGKGDLDAANLEFQQVLSVDPHFVAALKNLAVNELTLKHPSDAEKHLVAAEQLSLQDPAIHTYLAETAYLRKDYQRAIAEFQRGGEHAIHNLEIAVHVVESYLRTGRQDSALELAR